MQPEDQSNLRPELAKYGVVYTTPGDLPFIRGWKDRAQKLAQHFDTSPRPSFALIGEPGVGKTSVLHTLFRELCGKGWKVIETSTTEIISGAIYIGELETRAMNLAEKAPAKDGFIVFVSDFQNFVKAGQGSKKNTGMADALLPFLERSDLIIIGECTPEGWRRGIESHPALKAQITPFRLGEIDNEEAETMIQHAVTALNDEDDMLLPRFSHPLSRGMVDSLLQLGPIYFPGTAHPGAAIKLLKKAAETALSDPEVTDSFEEIVIDQNLLVDALHEISGLPVNLLSDSIALNLKDTQDFFEKRVIGQDEAVRQMVDVVTLIKAGLNDPGKPISVMLFAGPTGVGKTEIAKALAEYLFGAPDRMIRCDMSEYKDHDAHRKFIGHTDSQDDSGSLVKRVRQQPFSVILLDEVEKANLNIFDLLLQAFDDGRLTDANGNTTNLTQTIIIMTSNLGADLARSMQVGFEPTAPSADEEVEKALRNFFRPEFLNRIDRVIRFQPLQPEHIRLLARRELGKALLRNGLIRRGLRVSVEPEVYDLLAQQGYDSRYGARPLRRKVEELAVLPVARQIVGLGPAARGALLRLSVTKNEIGVNVVEDRQTRTARRMIGGISIADPIDGKKSKVTIKTLSAESEALTERSRATIQRLDEEELDERKDELVEHSHREDFWDDPDEARQVLEEIFRIERLKLAALRGEEVAVALAEDLAKAQKKADEKALQHLANRLRSARRHAQLVEYAIECRESTDRRDAFLVLRTASGDCSGKPVELLLQAYQKWAKRHDYEFRIIHEDSEDGALREVICEICGPAACGIFQAEEGEHEFVVSRRKGRADETEFVSVRVLGTALSGKTRGFRVRSRGAKIDSVLGEPLCSLLDVRDPKSSRSVELRSRLRAEELKEAGRALLAAELEHSVPDASLVVRKYFLDRPQRIFDRRSSELSVKVQDFWNGDLDELLFIGILHRKESTDSSAA